jgi:heptosyltransferase-2/heptosyltransferase-3
MNWRACGRVVDTIARMPHAADFDAEGSSAPLVVRFPALGDLVLLTVLLEALWRRYGQRVKVLGSGPWTRQLLAHDEAVAEVRLVTSRRAPHWLMPSRWSANAWLRAHRGPVYLCERDVYGARIVERAGLPEGQIVRAWDHWPGNDVHWADWWLDVARLDAALCPGPAHMPGVAPRPRLHPDPAWAPAAQAWLREQGLGGRPLVLVQPGHKKTFKRGRIGTGSHDKHWPPERWAAVVRGVLADLPGAAVLLCGSDREAGLTQEIVDAVGAVPADSRVVNIAALRPTLARLVSLASLAHSMISVDTGPAHVAGAMDCPLLVLYGKAGWGRWRPRAASAQVVTLGPQAPTPGARLMDLQPEDVLAAWLGLSGRVAK